MKTKCVTFTGRNDAPTNWNEIISLGFVPDYAVVRTVIWFTGDPLTQTQPIIISGNLFNDPIAITTNTVQTPHNHLTINNPQQLVSTATCTFNVIDAVTKTQAQLSQGDILSIMIEFVKL